MIHLRLTHCPFCQSSLLKSDKSSYPYLDCPKEKQHPNKAMWVWYLNINHPNQPTDFNIRLYNYQLGWSLERLTSKLITYAADYSIPTKLIEFPHLLDFELIENNINNKINTILSFL
jgi:hypothetical protein